MDSSYDSKSSEYPESCSSETLVPALPCPLDWHTVMDVSSEEETSSDEGLSEPSIEEPTTYSIVVRNHPSMEQRIQEFIDHGTITWTREFFQRTRVENIDITNAVRRHIQIHGELSHAQLAVREGVLSHRIFEWFHLKQKEGTPAFGDQLAC